MVVSLRLISGSIGLLGILIGADSLLKPDSFITGVVVIVSSLLVALILSAIASGLALLENIVENTQGLKTPNNKAKSREGVVQSLPKR